MIGLRDAERLDQDDPLAGLRAAFALPPGLIYLDGNSLGALPAQTSARIAHVVERQWGRDLIQSWNGHQWITLALRVGDRIAPLIGAEAGEVVAADSTSVNLFKLLSAALRQRPDRRVILSDSGNFPNDLYIAEGVAELLHTGHELRIVEPAEVGAAIDDDVAVVMLTDVDYRTGRRHDMKALTARAHAVGAIAIWDLCHSAGAVDVDVNDANVDLAVGCGYKYLNGGPGAPAFMFVAKRHQQDLRPALSGWMGHERPFEFDLSYHPATGIARNLAGTPSILGLTALDSALDIFDRTDMAAIRAKSLALGDLFIRLADERLAGHGLELATPRAHADRGSHVSLRHPHGYGIVQALVSNGVVGDFRSPDILRFGMTPLYTRYRDVWEAIDRLDRLMRSRSYLDPVYEQRAAVT